MGEDAPDLYARYAAWLRAEPELPDGDRKPFFTDGMVVLDTNVLLNLYEYTLVAREQVFAALGQVQDRLWLPHQVGLEFVRGRHRVIHTKMSALGKASQQVNERLANSKRTLLDAGGFVQDLLVRYARDEEGGRRIGRQVNEFTFDEKFDHWKSTLLDHVNQLKQAQDIALKSLQSDDPVLPRVAKLFGARIGQQPSLDLLRARIDNAVNFRFPNQIPPGFSDTGKMTPMRAAGDFLLWEEIVEKMRDGEWRRVLFISSDTKNDWYEPAEPGRGGPRPWPMLFEELAMRAGADLCIETPAQFYAGVEKYLNAEIADETYGEIHRATDVQDEIREISDAIDEENAAEWRPPVALIREACECVGIRGSAALERAVSGFRSNWVFQWWLIGVTAQLARRQAGAAEPRIELRAAVRHPDPPAEDWLPGVNLRTGEWPIRSSSWVAPWFVRVLSGVGEADRIILQLLAAEQADVSG